MQKEMIEMTSILYNLCAQIAIFAVLSSILVDGAKKAIRIPMKLKPEEKLKWIIPWGLTFLFGILCSFILKSEIITNIGIRISLGVSISLTSFVVYKSAVQGLLTLVPLIFQIISQRILGKKSA